MPTLWRGSRMIRLVLGGRGWLRADETHLPRGARHRFTFLADAVGRVASAALASAAKRRSAEATCGGAKATRWRGGGTKGAGSSSGCSEGRRDGGGSKPAGGAEAARSSAAGGAEWSRGRSGGEWRSGCAAKGGRTCSLGGKGVGSSTERRGSGRGAKGGGLSSGTERRRRWRSAERSGGGRSEGRCRRCCTKKASSRCGCCTK